MLKGCGVSYVDTKDQHSTQRSNQQLYISGFPNL